MPAAPIARRHLSLINKLFNECRAGFAANKRHASRHSPCYVTQIIAHFIFQLLFCICWFASSCSGATYYVSPSGNDSNSGLSPQDAWKTTARVSSAAGFEAGDSILFEAGERFAGTVRLDARSRGLPEAPIVIGSYGPKEGDRATLDAGTGAGIDLYNTAGIQIVNLNITGSGPVASNTSSGVIFCTDSSKSNRLAHIDLHHLTISGFGKHGITIGTWNSVKGYKDVKVTDCITHDNFRSGICVWGQHLYAHSHISVAGCVAYNIKGGSGIILSSVDGGVIERCVAHDTGEEVSGAVGIWAYDSKRISIQFNESYDNRTIRDDGDGFDLDGGVIDSVMQYNYSHGNDAAGYLLAQYPGSPQAMENVVIRYNISENDCRKKSYGAIHVWNGETVDRIIGAQIYNNTIYVSPSPAKASSSAMAVVSPTTRVAIRNNIFVTTGGVPLLEVVPGQIGLRIENNNYWTGGDPFTILWEGTPCTSLAKWLEVATMQERVAGVVTGMNVDPLLLKPGARITLNNADALATLGAYKLNHSSPVRRRGLNLRSQFQINPGGQDFYGTPLPSEGDFDLGAYQTPEEEPAEEIQQASAQNR